MPYKLGDDDHAERHGLDKPWPDEERGYLDELAERHHPVVPRCINCNAEVWWSFPRPEDSCYECKRPIGNAIPQAADGLTQEQTQAFVDAAAHAQEGAPYVAPELHRVAILAQPGDEFCAGCGKRFTPGEDVMVSMPDGEFRHDECVEPEAGEA